MYLRPGGTGGVRAAIAVIPETSKDSFVRAGTLSLQFAATVSHGWRKGSSQRFIRHSVSSEGSYYRAVDSSGDVPGCICCAFAGDKKFWGDSATPGNSYTSAEQEEK